MFFHGMQAYIDLLSIGMLWPVCLMFNVDCLANPALKRFSNRMVYLLRNNLILPVDKILSVFIKNE